MPNTQNEQVKTDTSFEENYIDENVSVKTNKTKEFIKKFMKRKTAVAAFFVMCFLLLMALFGPSLAPYAPEAYDYDNILAGPSASHLFGTDQYGRDIFSRILAGTPLTLGVSLSSVIVGAALGTVLGLLAGYYGGWIEMLVMRGADVLFSFPDILLAIAIVALLGPGIVNVFIAVAVFTVPSFARIMRSATLAVKGSLYVEVARSLGCKDGRILFVHIFPGTLHHIPLIQPGVTFAHQVINPQYRIFSNPLGAGIDGVQYIQRLLVIPLENHAERQFNFIVRQSKLQFTVVYNLLIYFPVGFRVARPI